MKWTLIVIITILSILTAYYFFPEKQLPSNKKIKFINVSKNKRRMMVYSEENALLKIYHISLGKQPKGDKEFEGDMKTPEGKYFLNEKRKKSIYYKGFVISYPDKKHIENAKKLNKTAGGNILIHSIPDNWKWVGKFHRFVDWTNGCIAVTNDEMDELWENIDVGTQITITE